MSSLFYLYHGRKKESVQERILMYGFAIFWFSIALIRIFIYFSDYYLVGIYTGELNIIIQTYDTGKYILLYFYLYLFAYVLISIITLSLLFIWFSIKLKKEFQIVSSVVTIGFVMILIGWAFETMKMNLIYPAISSIFIIIGTITAISPLIIDLEFFSSRLANWLILILIISILGFLGLTFFTNFSINIMSQIIIWISTIVIVIAIIYIIVHITKRIRVAPISTPMDKRVLPDFIKTFTKPSTITIEEIELYRKKGLCLVCKSKVSRLNYICPKCNAIYCIKCSEALTNLENACWICDTPFDESRS
ncbi:MAG: hypothetical protein ACFFCI_16560 [Promethearchaeota archaeon]